jgi:alpha-glucoside transport system permease protein
MGAMKSDGRGFFRMEESSAASNPEFECRIAGRKRDKMPDMHDQETSPQEDALQRQLLQVLLVLPACALLYGVWLGLKWAQNAAWIPPLGKMILALALGMGGLVVFFLLVAKAVDPLPQNILDALNPILFIGPAIAVICWILIVPMARTVLMSFLDANGVQWVGLQNYVFVFTDRSMLNAFVNNSLWLLLGSGGSVAIGLVIAVLADRTHPRFGSLIQSMIFMPMAISMVGASIIWRFVYAYVPAGSSQIGVLNAAIVALGGQPDALLMIRGINTLLLIVVFIWIQTGFSMVIFSAAIKTIPEEILEAARIDGANQWQITWSISLPYLQSTIVAVSTIVIVLTLKVFDVVYVMTGGNYGTEVIANQFYFEMFRKFNYGHGSAIVVLLVALILPVMAYNLRHYRETMESNP